MTKKILITGGAGFVGSHLADELLGSGCAVRILDSIDSQVHGEERQVPNFLADDVEFFRGDIRDMHAVTRALQGVDAVYHFAATVGVGQSMYEIERYTEVNAVGTAVLLEALAHQPIERLVVASSMSIYGEGFYRTQDGRCVEAPERTTQQLKRRQWDPADEQGRTLVPIPTSESKRPSLPSVYAISKYYQERLCLSVGRAYGIETVALRFFNIYGSRQALSNPYTGVLAIFASRLLNGKPPLINEDGFQKRDFVNVRDIVQACRLALQVKEAADQVFNIGSGESHSVREIAELMGEAMGVFLPPEITGKFRHGDIRNCFADISSAQKILGYHPQVSLADGLKDLAAWVENQTAIDRVDDAAKELLSRGLAA